MFHLLSSILIIVFGLSVMADDKPRSGYEYLKPATQEMQDDDFSNPGMVTVDRGRKLYHMPGNNDKSCARCHGEEGSGIDRKKVAQYPIFNAEEERPYTLHEQINFCHEEYQDNVPYVYGCVELVALETYVRHLAKGEPVNVQVTDELEPFHEKGRELYHTRMGRIDMSCSHCHDKYPGRMLRGQILTQGQSNGFPEYRLGSGKVTGLHHRFQECFRSFKADPYELGSDEYINLELYLNARGNGLKIETPAVRY